MIIKTIGELRKVLEQYDENDRIVYEELDPNEDVKDLHHISIDEFDGVTLENGDKGMEIRFCKVINHTM